MKIDPPLRDFIKSVLEEDLEKGDLTTSGLGIQDLRVKACILAREEGVLAGLDVVHCVFKLLGRIKWESEFKDGDKFERGNEIARLEGKASVILGAERTALNFLSHLSGVATLTNKFVTKAKGKVKIYDTRKTLPGLRKLEKYAVRVGGGCNHRMDLSQALMIKENHIAIFRKIYGGEDYLIQMIKRLRSKYPRRELIVEVKSFEEWEQVKGIPPTVVMFDNWCIDDLREALRSLREKKFEVEISGRIDLENIDSYLKLPIDRISIGCITHSAPIVDFSLEILP